VNTIEEKVKVMIDGSERRIETSFSTQFRVVKEHQLVMQENQRIIHESQQRMQEQQRGLQEGTKEGFRLLVEYVISNEEDSQEKFKIVEKYLTTQSSSSLFL